MTDIFGTIKPGSVLKNAFDGFTNAISMVDPYDYEATYGYEADQISRKIGIHPEWIRDALSAYREDNDTSHFKPKEITQLVRNLAAGCKYATGESAPKP